MNGPYKMQETIIKRYQTFYLWDNTELVYKALQMDFFSIVNQIKIYIRWAV